MRLVPKKQPRHVKSYGECDYRSNYQNLECARRTPTPEKDRYRGEIRRRSDDADDICDTRGLEKTRSIEHASFEHKELDRKKNRYSCAENSEPWISLCHVSRDFWLRNVAYGRVARLTPYTRARRRAAAP